MTRKHIKQIRFFIAMDLGTGRQQDICEDTIYPRPMADDVWSVGHGKPERTNPLRKMATVVHGDEDYIPNTMATLEARIQKGNNW